MKVYHAIDENSSLLSKKDKERIALLKLVDAGKYIKDVGIRDGQFYILVENDTDEIYLEYKVTLQNIQALMNTKIDFKLLEEKNREYHTKKNIAMYRFMEIPR